MRKCRDCVGGLFGACRPDHCLAERQGLIEEAQRSAAEHGHRLGEFVKLDDVAVWEARCLHCEKIAGIRLDPNPGEPDLYGEVLVSACSGTRLSQAPGTAAV